MLEPNALTAASLRGAFHGPEIDLEHSLHVYSHMVSLWSVPLIFQRLALIGCDGLGVQEEKIEDANGGAMLFGLKY